MSANELLQWLLYSGGVVLVVSWVLDRWPWFLGLLTEQKQLVFRLAVVVAGLAVYAATVYVPADFWALADPWVKVALSLWALTKAGEYNHDRLS